jgi:hypothetical protein
VDSLRLCKHYLGQEVDHVLVRNGGWDVTTT